MEGGSEDDKDEERFQMWSRPFIGRGKKSESRMSRMQKKKCKSCTNIY